LASKTASANVFVAEFSHAKTKIIKDKTTL